MNKYRLPKKDFAGKKSVIEVIGLKKGRKC